MCGIAGICNLKPGHRMNLHDIQRMMAQIRHRGPDQMGIYLDDTVGLGHLRLSIVDLRRVPAHPQRRRDALDHHNGEVFNYIELRRLQSKATFYHLRHGSAPASL
jgi:asparagine synthase (glutamine-hydrolysing)